MQSMLLHHTQCNIRFNIILPSTPRSSKWSLKSPHQKPVYTFPCLTPRHSWAQTSFSAPYSRKPDAEIRYRKQVKLLRKFGFAKECSKSVFWNATSWQLHRCLNARPERWKQYDLPKRRWLLASRNITGIVLKERTWNINTIYTIEWAEMAQSV